MMPGEAKETLRPYARGLTQESAKSTEARPLFMGTPGPGFFSRAWVSDELGGLDDGYRYSVSVTDTGELSDAA